MIALLLYYTNDGQFRGMAVFGVVCGFVLYYFTVGRLVISVSRILVFVIKAVLAYMVLFAAFPSALLFKALKLVAQKIHGRLRTVRYKKRSAVFTERQIAELCKRAGNGFLDLPDTDVYKRQPRYHNRRKIQSGKGTRRDTDKCESANAFKFSA